MPACDERFGSNELAERLSESAERVYPDGFIRSEFRAIVLQASQGVGMLAGPGLRGRAFELSKESPRVANFYVAFGTFVGI
jgi:hypothetical protein